MHTILVIAGCLALAACNGDDGPADDGAGTSGTEGTSGSGSADETGNEPVVEEQTVPLDVAALALDAMCVPLEQLPDQLSMSPEGHLWLRLDAETWRVLDPFGNDDTQVLPPDVGALQAWSHDRAFFIDEGGGLWDVQGEWPQPLAWPMTLADPTAMCGDPSSDGNGFVVAEGLLHRDVGQWWEWTDPSGDSWSDVTWMARSAGACLGGDGDLWVSEGGEVWRITGDLATRMESFDGAPLAALVDGLGAAVVIDGDMHVGGLDLITHYTFEAGAVTALTSGGESLWAIAGGTLHRLLDGEFTASTLEGDAVEPGLLLAEAGGGVWTLTEQEACHLRPAPPVRIEGVSNLQRLVSETVDIAVELSMGASLDGVTLDGEALSMEADGTDRFVAPTQTVAEGWHTLEVQATATDGSTTRRLRFEQRRVGDLTWTTDVEPLFTEHCSGGACHGPQIDDATRPDLSTWEAWTEREDSILDRVVTKGDMPPAAMRKDTWGLELQLLVSEWYETGAEQGDG